MSEEWDDSIDDISLSQSLEVSEAWDDAIDDIHLSQAVDFLDKQMPLSEVIDIYLPDSDSEETLKPDFSLSQFKTVGKKEVEDVFIAMEEREANENRFGPICDDDTIRKLVKDTESKNTRKNTGWSKTTFDAWRQYRAKNGSFVPDLQDMGVCDINKWLSKFVVEVRRKDGAPYPPRSLYQLCVGLLRYMRENGNHLNFLDEKNSQFYEFRQALSARMSELTSAGVGTVPRQADPITRENETIMWEKGVLGDSSAKSMLNTVFFYNCKLFGLRGVDEHRNLAVDQFELQEDPQPSLIFKGRTNKTYKGTVQFLMLITYLNKEID